MPLFGPYPSLAELEEACKSAGRLKHMQRLDDEQAVCDAVAATVGPEIQEPKGLRASKGVFAVRWLGDAGCATIGPLLAANSALRELDLSCNCIGPAGCVALFAGLGTNSTVSSMQGLHIDRLAPQVGGGVLRGVLTALLCHS